MMHLGGRCPFIAVYFGCVLLLDCFLFVHALAPEAGAPSGVVSSWVVPRNVKFGKLSSLSFLPDGDPSSRGGDTQREGERDYGGTRTLRVATTAVGLNFADVFTVLGLYKAANLVRDGAEEDGRGGGDGSSAGLPPFVPGIEFAGVVLDDGAGFRRGDRVFGFTRFGAYSDVVRANPNFIRRVPSHWSFEQGASFLVNALTAWHGLVNVGGMPDLNDHKQSRLYQGRPYVVVVHSASGGVGLWASEIAARRGAVVVGVVGSEGKKKAFMDRVGGFCKGAQCIVRANNADEFDRNLAEACQKARESSHGNNAASKSPLYSNCLQAAEGKCGADLVMECYGGKYFRPSMEIINPGGSLSTYGATTYNDAGTGDAIPFLSLVWNYIRRPRVDPGQLTGCNIRVGGFNLIFLTENIDTLVQSLDNCVECLCSPSDDTNYDFDKRLEQVKPPLVGSVFPFRNADGGGAISGLKALRSGNTVGKVVLSNWNNPLLC